MTTLHENRGEAWVAAQVGIFALAAAAPRWEAAGFFDAKARREEAWLVERFPDYAVYRRHDRKLIPGLY